MQNIGFGSEWTGPEKTTKEATTLWRKLQEEIGEVRDKLILLTISVVVFVAALGCLTLAELWRHNRYRRDVMPAVGSVVTVGGLVLAICSDPVSAPYFGAAFALFIAFGFVGTYLAPYIAGFAERVSIRMSFLTPEELEESVKEEEETPHPGDNLVMEGLRETQNAVRGDQSKQLPFLRFNLGVSEFAVGNFAGATDAYKNALATASAENLEDGLAVASINDLEVFLHYCPGIRSADDCKKVRDMSDDLKQQFVTAAWPVPKTNSNSGDPRPRIRDLWLVANPAGLGWRAKLDKF
ncbi:MAG: hypothetical protein WBL70_14650 [Candidatus Acidiferrales bacterium]